MRRGGRRDLAFTRRSLLVGLAACGLDATHGAFALAPLRIGCVEEPGGAALAALGRGLARLGLMGRLVPHLSWGSLADHLVASGLDGAVLPTSAVPYGMVVIGPTPGGPVPAATIVAARSLPENRPLLVARAVADPVTDARLALELDRRGLAGRPLLLRELAPAMLFDNVDAGLLDLALLTGTRALGLAEQAAASGLGSLRFEGARAAALTPDTSVVLRSALATPDLVARLIRPPYPTETTGGRCADV